MNELSRAWIRTGAVAGVLGVVSYLLAAFAPLPDRAALGFAFAFGPLVSVAMVGLYHALAADRPTPMLQSGAILGIAAGIVVLVMLTTQQAIQFVTADAASDLADTERLTEAKRLRAGLDAVHLGIDVAWDVLIGTAVILYAFAMPRHPMFGKTLGLSGVLLGTLLLAFNLYHFPVPPANAESIDWGPFVALWMLVVFIVMLVRGGAYRRE